jgi:hypothetical protein
LEPENFFLLFRNYFLDFDGWGHVHALDNFNPSQKDIQQKTALGIRFMLFIELSQKKTKLLFIRLPTATVR